MIKRSWSIVASIALPRSRSLIYSVKDIIYSSVGCVSLLKHLNSFKLPRFSLSLSLPFQLKDQLYIDTKSFSRRRLALILLRNNIYLRSRDILSSCKRTVPMGITIFIIVMYTFRLAIDFVHS